MPRSVGCSRTTALTKQEQHPGCHAALSCPGSTRDYSVGWAEMASIQAIVGEQYGVRTQVRCSVHTEYLHGPKCHAMTPHERASGCFIWRLLIAGLT